MKLKNLLLLWLLLVTTNAWAAVETKDPVVGEHTDFAPAVVDGDDREGATGGAGAGAADAVASSIPAEGSLAKLELLRGQLTGVPEAFRGATLVHGAMLWEFGIVKSLYTLLITPEKDAKEQLVAGKPICPLGAVLKQLFYLAEGTFFPTRLAQSFAYKLTPKMLGELYAAFMNESIAAWNPITSTLVFKSKTQANRQKYQKEMDLLKESLKDCYTVGALNPVNLCPSIIMAYFWVKHIMLSENLATARANLSEFNEAAFARSSTSAEAVSASAKEAHVSEQSPDAVEAEAIERIMTFYKYDMPKPPVQGTAELSRGRSFADCGESGLRGLFQAIFYNKETQDFVIPGDVPEAFYDNMLGAFFKEYPTVADQNNKKARNAWAAVISDRSDIGYLSDGCDMNSDFKNVMCMLAQLVPGVYRNLCTSCECQQKAVPTEAASGAGGDVNVVADDSLPAQIAAHFERSPDCAKKMLAVFAECNNLFLSEYDSEDNKDDASWNLSCSEPEEALCFLVYKTQREHMDCQLEGALSSTFGQFIDPILGCSDALTTTPQDPDMIQPLVFAAACMAQQQDFMAGYLALLPGLDFALLKQITEAISGWDLLTPEDEEVLFRWGLLAPKDDEAPEDDEEPKLSSLEEAASRGLVNTCRFLCSTAGIGTEFYFFTLPLCLAIRNGFLPVVKYLCEQGADVNEVIPNDDWLRTIYGYGCTDECPLSLAARKGDLPIVRYLCEAQNVVRLGSNQNAAKALGHAAHEGHLSVVKYLCEEQNVDRLGSNQNAAIALSNAFMAGNGDLSVAKYLCEERGTDVNITNGLSKPVVVLAAMESVMQGNSLAAVQYLCEQGATALDDALLAAALCQNLPVVKYLCEQSVLVNALSEHGETPLMFAVMNGDLPTVKYLCEKGADLSVINKDGKTVLMYTVEPLYLSNAESVAKKIPIIDYLCKEHGVNLNQTNAAGMTILMYAVTQQNLLMCTFFVEHGADVNARNNEGATALDCAEAHGFNEIADYLRPLTATDA